MFKKLGDLNVVGYKVRLFPTKVQEKIFYEYFGMSRFVYNKTIDLQEEYYEANKYNEDAYKFLGFIDLRNKIRELQDTSYPWLANYSTESIRGAVQDCVKAYEFFKNKEIHNRHPKYKSRIYSKKQFYTRPDRLLITENFVCLSSIGKIKYCNSYGNEILGIGDKNSKHYKYTHFYNSRISFDGLYFYLTFNILRDEKHQIHSYWNYSNNEEWQEKEFSEPIGIDVGLKNEKWFVDSTGTKIERPDSTVLNKKINRLQRKYDRQKKLNLSKNSSFMEQHPNGSKNMQKTREKINKCFKKITNRRRNAVHEYGCRLLDKKPSAIVMESISLNRIIYKNNNVSILNQMVMDAALYESMQIIQNKLEYNGIPVIRADANYPSSQLCSCCGYRQDIGKRKTYQCPNCGTVIDRDLNAAINLKKLAYCSL